MKKLSYLIVVFASQITLAQDGIIVSCGASSGTGYFIQDPIFFNQPSEWADDGISNGKISLIKLGDEWDILFGDALGDAGYRQQGATVIPLTEVGGLLTVGVFHQNFTDIYSFNIEAKEVIWTSHKGGPLIKKVAIYRASCN